MQKILSFVSPCSGYVRSKESMFPGKFMWQLKVTGVSVLRIKSALALHVSGEGLAPIVRAYSRLILVDGSVL
jgi:hypothetical protein